MAYRLVGGDELQRYHLKSTFMGGGGKLVGGVTPKLKLSDGTQLGPELFSAASNPDRHRAAVEQAMKAIAACGKVGAALVDLANSTDLEIVCWYGVPGEFLCPHEVSKLGKLDGWDDGWGDCRKPTIMWDPYLCFAYFSRHMSKGMWDTMNSVDRHEYTQGVRVKSWNASDPGKAKAMAQEVETVDKRIASLRPQVKPSIMPAWVVLGHELGHYMHWAKEPAWFEKALDANQINVIEARNLVDHEQPLLQYINLPIRYLYQDFQGGANDIGTAQHAMQTFMQGKTLTDGSGKLTAKPGADVLLADQGLQGQLTRLKQAKERADSQVAYEAPKLVAGTCPYCPEKFKSNSFLNNHIRLKHPGKETV